MHLLSCIGLGSLSTSRLDKIIALLLQTSSESDFALSTKEVKRIVNDAREAVLAEPSLLDLPASGIIVVGDLHGQFQDMKRIFDRHGLPPQTKYIFLGDYIDRGPQGLEVMTLALVLKLRYPQHIYLLRGNHECAEVSLLFGFRAECDTRAAPGVWEAFITVFDALPLAARIQPPISVMCVHGGIGPYIRNIEQIKEIERPINIAPDSPSLLTDLLWADPSSEVDMWSSSQRGTSFQFGLSAAQQFLKKNGLRRIVRGHKASDKGFEVLGEDGEVVTVFSAPNYKKSGGYGAVMMLAADGSYQFDIIPPS